MIQPQASEAGALEATVNQYLERHDLTRTLGARVLPGSAQRDEWGWTVSVGSEHMPPRTFAFVDELGDIADEILENEKIEVLIAPSGHRPSEFKQAEQR